MKLFNSYRIILIIGFTGSIFYCCEEEVFNHKNEVFLLDSTTKFFCLDRNYEEYEDYIPLPWNNCLWRTEINAPNNYGGHEKHEIIHYPKKDTFMMGRCYHEIYMKKHVDLIYEDTIISYDSEYLYAWVRQEIESKKVYCVYANIAKFHEYLLYDFDIQLGDTISDSLYGSSATKTVYSIDSVIIAGRMHNRYTIRVGNLLNAFYLIEGIGTSKGLFGGVYDIYTSFSGLYIDSTLVYLN